jgi:hypothetical protein
VTFALASIDDEEFLGRSSSGEHNFLNGDPVKNFTSLFNFSIIVTFFLEVDSGKFIAVNNDSVGLSH